MLLEVLRISEMKEEMPRRILIEDDSSGSSGGSRRTSRRDAEIRVTGGEMRRDAGVVDRAETEAD